MVDQRPWQHRIDVAIKAAEQRDLALEAAEEARRQSLLRAFQGFVENCDTVVRPTLEDAADLLRERGFDAQVIDQRSDGPSAPTFELALRIERQGDRGRADLTFRGSASSDGIRITEMVGHRRTGTGFHKEEYQTAPAKLTPEFVGGRIADLMEMLLR